MTKHSAVVSVCTAGEYLAMSLGVYSARKQYRPGSIGPCPGWGNVIVAWPFGPPPTVLTTCGPPTGVPPWLQAGGVLPGPQTKN